MIEQYISSSRQIDGKLGRFLLCIIDADLIAENTTHSQSILKSLEKGENVVCDRYAFSGIAYSAAKVRPTSSLLLLLYSTVY